MVPTETMLEKPMFSLKLLSNIAVSRAPLWLRSPTLPCLAMAPAKVALRPVTGFITPEAVGAYDPHPTPPGLGEDPLL